MVLGARPSGKTRLKASRYRDNPSVGSSELDAMLCKYRIPAALHRPLQLGSCVILHTAAKGLSYFDFIHFSMVSPPSRPPRVVKDGVSTRTMSLPIPLKRHFRVLTSCAEAVRSPMLQTLTFSSRRRMSRNLLFTGPGPTMNTTTFDLPDKRAN